MTAQSITLAIAVLGAVLGIVNTIHALSQSRVRFKVQPGHAIAVGGAPENLNLSIQITNLGAVPITIDEVGVLFHGTEKRSVIMPPVMGDGGSWPRRLEPRSSVTVYGEAPAPAPSRRIRCAFATTQCGITKTGNSPALKQIARGR